MQRTEGSPQVARAAAQSVSDKPPGVLGKEPAGGQSGKASGGGAAVLRPERHLKPRARVRSQRCARGPCSGQSSAPKAESGFRPCAIPRGISRPALLMQNTSGKSTFEAKSLAQGGPATPGSGMREARSGVTGCRGVVLVSRPAEPPGRGLESHPLQGEPLSWFCFLLHR